MVKKLNVVVVPYDALPCRCQTFTINGIVADENDFGSVCDCDGSLAEPYGCGDMQFTMKNPTNAILTKYHITLPQYGEVCDELKAKLAVGTCGWCV